MRLVPNTPQTGYNFPRASATQRVVGERLKALFESAAVASRLVDSEGVDGEVSDLAEVGFGTATERISSHCALSGELQRRPRFHERFDR